MLIQNSPDSQYLPFRTLRNRHACPPAFPQPEYIFQDSPASILSPFLRSDVPYLELNRYVYIYIPIYV